MMKKKQILAVDDDPFSLLLIKEYLKNLDVSVYSVKNGKEAVEFCRNNKTDLIITDILMPVMDGIAAINEIKKYDCKVRILAQTAYAVQEKIEEIRSAGFDAIILKPYRKEDFQRLVKKVLTQPQFALQ